LEFTAERKSPRAAQIGADAELVAAVLRKDRKAAAEFVARHVDAIHAFVRWRLSPDSCAVEDVLQEVFLDAWRGLARFRSDSSLASWLMGIARHKVHDHFRRVLRDAHIPDDAGETIQAKTDLERSAWEGQRRERVERALAALPEDYRVALLWRYWDQRPAAEIARETNRTEKAVERLLARAREKFRSAYEAE